MKRFFVLVAALLISWLIAPAAAASDPPMSIAAASTCAYDTSPMSALPNATAPDRGPPTWDSTSTSTYCAVGSWSNGAATRLDGPTPAVATIYANSAELAQVARAMTTTGGQVEVADGALSVVPGERVAANAGTRTGPPRDAFGRFTSGAGGESAATAAGRSAHAHYANTLGGGNYVFNRALPGSRLRPDAVDYSQNIVRELKPGTPGGISRGWRQVNQYKAYLEELTGQPWTAYVDVYTP